MQETICSPHNDSGILDAGDIESMPFIEALGQFSYRVGEKTVDSIAIYFYFLSFANSI
jgi:CTP synthase (UTP-ammonia lyase)